MTDAMRIGSEKSAICEQFIRDLRAISNAHVLELGTLRADPDVPTHHHDWVHAPGSYTMVDFQNGPDVDVICDAHELSVEFNCEMDAIIAVAVWEHLERPWDAARELAYALVPGGIAYISTHQTFPLHGYGAGEEGDYFRFSKSALELIFEDAGLETVSSGYMYPCQIVPPQDVASGRWNSSALAYLVVDAYFRKPL